MILFTYVVGLMISFLTNQLNPIKFQDMIFTAIISIAVFGVAILFLNRFNYHLTNIPKEMKKLK